MKIIIILVISITAFLADAQIVRSTIGNADKDTNYHGPAKVEAVNEALTVVKRRKTIITTNIVSVRDGNGDLKEAFQIRTNEVDAPIDFILDYKKAEEMRMQKIELERKQGVNKEIRARWDFLKERDKQLKKGMEPEEVVKIMDKPDWIETPFRESAELVSSKRVSLEDIQGKAVESTWGYSPYKEVINAFNRPKGPYDWLMLHFGADGKLDLWSWGM